MLRVYLSAQTDLLATSLVQVLPAIAPADPLQLQSVAVGNPDSGRWLKHYLAQHQLICAALDTPLLSRAIWSLGNRAAGLPDSPDPLDENRLAWGLFEHLPSWLDTDLPELDQAYQVRLNELQDPEGARWMLARELAGLYDRYLVYRPDWILEWQAGGESSWQGRLWQRLQGALGQPEHRAERWKTALTALTDYQASTPLVVFNPGPVPRPLLEQVAAFAQNNDVIWFQFSPSTEYFGDLETPRQSSRSDRLAELPFVGSMVPAVKSQIDFLSEHGQVTALDREPTHENSLTQLQRSITELSALAPVVCDDSLEITHAPGPIREVEELKEWLVPKLESPALNPRDVLILTPDVERFAPLVRAVFEDPDTGYLPVAVLDRTQGDADPAMAALLGLLNLIDHLERDATLDWLALPPVMTRYGLSEEDLGVLREWAHAGGWIRGLDAQTPSGGPQIHHFQGMLDRLLLSWVLDQPKPGYAIDRPLQSAQSESLNKLCLIYQDISRLARESKTARSLTEWWQLLSPMVTPWVEPESALAEFIADWQALTYQGDLSLATLKRFAQESAQKNAQNARFAAGRINLCTPLPARGLPFKLVCLIGFESGAFPRAPGRSDLDLMITHPRPGDRQPNQEDRALFLEALMNAQDGLYLSWTGTDPKDGTEVPPCVPVGLLMQHLGIQELPPSQPINSASRSLFQRSRVIDARRLVRATPQRPVMHPMTELPGSAEALRHALTEPFEYYLQQMLDIRLESLEQDSDLTPLGLSHERQALWLSIAAQSDSQIRWQDTPMAAEGAGGELTGSGVDNRLAVLRGWRMQRDSQPYIELPLGPYRLPVRSPINATSITLGSGARPSNKAVTRALLSHLALCSNGHSVTSLAIGTEESLEFASLAADEALGYFQQWIEQFWHNQTSPPEVSLGWIRARTGRGGQATKSSLGKERPMAFAERFGVSKSTDVDHINNTLDRFGPSPKPQATQDAEDYLGTA